MTDSESFSIGGRLVGAGAPCFIIAEVAQAHDGSLGTAHAYIDAAADAKADAVKFQTHLAAAESTPHEPWRVRFSRQDATRYDYWQRMEFSEDQWRGLKDHAEERGLVFLSSPFSDEAVLLLERIGVSGWKVASGETGNLALIQRMVDAGGPVILSSGMSNFAELDITVDHLRRQQVPHAILQCTTEYPCPPERVGINVIGELRERYHCPAGLSDHSGTIYPALAAVMVKAAIIEVHMTFHRRAFGPDVPASLTIEELSTMIDGVRYLERMIAAPVNKQVLDSRTISLRGMFTKSVVARSDLPAGTVLTAAMLAMKKPGTGIPGHQIAKLFGRQLRCDVAADDLITEEHLEPAQS